MAHLERRCLILLVILAAVLLADQGTAQQMPSFPAAFEKRKPFQRWWWAFEQRAYPLGHIPAGARERALQQIEQSKAALPPPPQPVRGDQWVSIGPAPILGGQVGVTGGTRPMSGRIGDIAVHPTDPNHWLVGGSQGGIWRTLDGGTTWTPLTDAQASLAMGAIAFAPSNPSIIYAGTGEGVFSGDAYAGAGLLRSGDGGTTWTLLAAATFQQTTFSDLKVHATNPNIVLAATASGIAGRGGIALPNPPATGILRSTDGGATWSVRLSGEATDLEVDPRDFNNQYAGIGDASGDAANGVYRSTDGGQTWSVINGPWSTMTGGVGRVELALAPSNPNVLYVSVQDAVDTVGTDGGLLGLWRTDNAWDPTPGWTRIPTGATDDGTGVHGYCGWDRAFNSAGDQCWYNHEIVVDPTNPDILYAGGIPLWKCANCTETGATWVEVSKTVFSPANGIHVDQHTMAWAPVTPAAPAPRVALGQPPLGFEPNQGQSDGHVKFLARGSGYALFLTSTEAVLSLRTPARSSGVAARRVAHVLETQAGRATVVRLKFLGANPAPQVVGLEALPGRVNYFRGIDPTRWRTGIPTYARVKYEAVYPGIDLIYYGSQGELESDFVVAPGADPGTIRLGFEGVGELRLDPQGDLVLTTGDGELRLRKPRVYQEVGGARREIPAGYVLQGEGQVGFEIAAAAYDATKPLVIDPVLSYSTYLGGSGLDFGGGVAVDALGRVYVTGSTDSPNFPGLGGVLPRDADVFVAKLNLEAEGFALVYTTIFGGSGIEHALGLALDGAGNAYVTGETFSGFDFPVVSAVQPGFGGGSQDAFVAKLGPTGMLVYATYLGGSGAEVGLGIAVDASGQAHVTGETNSSNFPTANALQGGYAGGTCTFPDVHPCFDAFVSKLSASGSLFVYSTYLGGSDDDRGFDVDLDGTGNAYVVGMTASANFPTTLGAFQTAFAGGGDAFVAKLNSAGSALVYSTYLGGSGGEAGEGIAVDALGQAHVTGGTGSADFPTTQGAYDRTCGTDGSCSGGTAGDAFITKLNAQGSGLVYSTYVGGSGSEIGYGIALDLAGNAYVTGSTDSADFPTVNAVQPTFAGAGTCGVPPFATFPCKDGFVTKVNSGGSALAYSTYLGGSKDEFSLRVAVDGCGGTYVTGWTESANFPVTLGALQPTFGGSLVDAFLAKIQDPSRRLIVGNDGGVWSSDDCGITWADHNTTLAITQFYDGSVHPTDPNFALGGSQDNGTEKWTGTNAWRWIFGGDGAASAISSGSPNTHWAVSSQNLGIVRTTDGGGSFNVADSGIDKQGAPFIARFEKCTANDDVFIAGTDNLWRSTNFFSAQNPSWLSNGPEMAAMITALAFAPSDTTCNTYAFGSSRGHLRLTTDGGTTWKDIDASNNVPARFVTDLAFDPGNPNVLYVTLSGFNGAVVALQGHVFRTANALAAQPTWTDVSPPVDIPHNTIALDPFDPNVVWVGTDIGVWKSIDGGSTWAHMGPEAGMPNVAVFDLKINHDTGRLLAFTHGRGAFALQRSGALALMVATNRPIETAFQLFEDLIVTVGVDNPGLAQTVDFYFGALLPDGDTIVFFTDLAFNSAMGRLSAPATLRPIVAGVDLTTPFTFTQPSFFTYRWTGGEPAGSYVLFVAAVVPGALADNSIDPGDVVALATAVVTFAP